MTEYIQVGFTKTSAYDLNPSHFQLDGTTISVSGAFNSGETFPTSPVVSQLFLHTPTGRKILYQYDGSAWRALASLGPMTLYVDKTNGTDDLNYGHGTTTSAFQTVAYAVTFSQIPSRNDYNVTINLTGEEYNESVYIVGAQTNIYINGQFSTVDSLTATGGSAGTATAAPYVSGTFSANAYNQKLIKFTSGVNNGLTYIVGQTTTTAIYFSPSPLTPLVAAPANGDTYLILDWATTIHKLWVQNSPCLVACANISFTTPGPFGTVYNFRGASNLVNCKSATNGAVSTYVNDNAYTQAINSLFVSTSNVAVYIIDALYAGGNCDISGGLIAGYGSGSNNMGIRAALNGGAIVRGVEITGCVWGVYSDSGGYIDYFTRGLYSFIHGNATYGSRATGGSSKIIHNSYVVYGKKLDGSADANGTDSSANATSFSWIG
jgi:hypothetical protein